ncbi:hypothetical protein [Pseudorhodoplanes sp.]|uniref:hypothetical protein n=1 Tax=Pseudorhodoplanes sp. TaxID=1934341 RepID=UPI003D14F78B
MEKYKVMARAKTSSIGELIAVAELKEMVSRIEHKLDLLLGTRSTESLTPMAPADEGPKGWEAEELKAWVADLDGLTRANIECGAVAPQDVWEAMKSEKGW